MDTAVDSAKIERYPAYKDSGVEWLGEIPEHWGIYKGKWLFIKQERTARKEDGIVTCFRDGEVTLRTNRKTEGFTIALKEHGYQGIRKGDLVIHNMDAFAGAIGISDSDGKSTPVYSACTPRIPNKVNSYYYAYFLKDLAKNGFIESLAKGIRERSTDFRFNDFGLLLLSVPPLTEQTAIASFLDRKTALIDQAIGIKQKQIELLKERRQILIHKAVTRGLNPNAKMKESGVEWIGEIPEGWNLSKLSNVAQTTSGSTPPSGNIRDYYNGEIPWVRTTDLNNDELFDVPEKITEKAIRDTACKIVPTNTVCIAMYGGAGTIGKHSILKFEGTVNQALCAIIHGDKLNPNYLYYYIKFYRPHWMITAKGSRVDPNINQDEVRKMSITLPSIDEQEQIVDHIEIASEKIATAITLKEQEIEKLKEYKVTLINSAVTGKIKVC